VGSGRFDALVIGSGPAGSVAALVLARGGARVALVDKAGFPRDKACGDLVGPRGVRLLADLGIAVGPARPVGDMVVVGPTSRQTRLPCYPGRTYPDHALAQPRARFDATLHEAAVAAGAVPFTGRAAEALGDDGGLEGFRLSTGADLRAGAVIGADGATSRVADAAGLVDPGRVLWGFAIRAYVEDPVSLPHILFWEPEAWSAFPGYGWLFPGVEGRANVGLGLGVLAHRADGARAAQRLDDFVAHLRRLGLLGGGSSSRPAPRLGGWLKMGMVGTVPARGRVLLTGDAAGLVNPLQGEGIAQAMASGRAAAEAVLAAPGRPAPAYGPGLAALHGRYFSTTASVHAAMVKRPRVVSGAGRLLTAPGLRRVLAGGWSIYWNDLLDGAEPGPARALASLASGVGRATTAGGRARRWFADQAGG
jgi:geranylgeranyl reductase family protein